MRCQRSPCTLRCCAAVLSDSLGHCICAQRGAGKKQEWHAAEAEKRKKHEKKQAKKVKKVGKKQDELGTALSHDSSSGRYD